VDSPKLLESQIQITRKSPKGSKQISILDFDIGKSCGKGMYGNVYAARLRTNGTLYALKKISKEIVIKNKMESQLAL
jgi:serine/threonine protein kinase